MAEMIARRIAAESSDGNELVDFALRVFRDPTMPFEDRKWAFEWLADRGAGKAMANVTIGGNVTHEHVRVNLEHYTFEEMEQMEALRRKAEDRARLAKATDAKVIDVLPPPNTP
jgi:hypothetical protein